MDAERVDERAATKRPMTADEIEQAMKRARVPARAINLILADGLPENVYQCMRRAGLGWKAAKNLRDAGLIAPGGYPAKFDAERAVEALGLE